jgi:glycosyltransferase involved in cell wall biosynthesis
MATAAETIDSEDMAAGGGLGTTFVSIVIPCLNEERTIGACVAEALAGLTAAGVPGEVVVCDNGSTDASAKLAAQAGARVVSCRARGYGNAVRSGVESARGAIIVVADGDGSYDLANITPFLIALSAGADLVVGNRFRGGIQQGAMPWQNKYLGTPVLTALVRLVFGARLGDVNCGLRACTRTAFEAISPRTPGMEFASEMIARAALAGLTLVEVPTVLRPDGRDRPPHLRPWRDGWRHLRSLVALRLRTWYAGRAKAGVPVAAGGSPTAA